MERDLVDVVAELDRRVAKEGAAVRFYQQGGGPEESAIRATPAGYLRLGVEFLRAASAPSADPRHPEIVDVDIGYLTSSDSTICFQLLERCESLEEFAEYELSGFDRVVPYLMLGLLGMGVLLSFVGLFTVVTWLL